MLLLAIVTLALQAQAGITIYIDKESTGNIYAWNADESNNAAWPGQDISSLTTATVNGTEYFAYTYEGEAAGLIFNDGSQQTGDILTPADRTIYRYTGGATAYQQVNFAVTSTSDINRYVYVWDENANNNTDIYKPLGPWGTADNQKIRNFTKETGSKLYAAYVWKRVSTQDVTYNAYIIFHDSGSNQSENIALNHGQAYTCKSDNSVTLEEGYPIIAAYFPDPAVRYYLNGSQFLHNDGTKSDADGNNILSPEEIATIDRFEMNANSLSTTIGAPTDFTGIELFTELTDINLAGTTRVKIMSPSIDLSNNTKLKSINISGAEALATLTLPETETLTKVSVTGSVLEALDVTHNPNLETLYIQKNQLGEIDLNHNTVLKSLYIQGGNIAEIDLSHNTALESLNLDNLKLSAVDITPLKQLQTLVVYDMPDITAIDLTQNPALVTVQLKNLGITAIDVTQNPELFKLIIQGCKSLTGDVDLSQNTKINEFELIGNQYSQANKAIVVKGLNGTKSLSQIRTAYINFEGNLLDLTDDTNLTWASLIACNIYELLVKGCTNLTNMNLTGNSLSAIDLEGVNNITWLNSPDMDNNCGFLGVRVVRPEVSFDGWTYRIYLRLGDQAYMEEKLLVDRLIEPYTGASWNSKTGVKFNYGTVNRNTDFDVTRATFVEGDYKTVETETGTKTYPMLVHGTQAFNATESSSVKGDILLLDEILEADVPMTTGSNPHPKAITIPVHYTYQTNYPGESAVINGTDYVETIQQWPMTVNAQIILTKDVVTAVKEVKSEAQVASVTYYNIVGMSSDKPFSGINVVVTRYSDGTSTTSKVIK